MGSGGEGWEVGVGSEGREGERRKEKGKLPSLAAGKRQLVKVC